jgi:hypothetical protein
MPEQFATVAQMAAINTRFVVIDFRFRIFILRLHLPATRRSEHAGRPAIAVAAQQGRDMAKDGGSGLKTRLGRIDPDRNETRRAELRGGEQHGDPCC